TLATLEGIVKKQIAPVVGLVLRARVAAVRSLAALAKSAPFRGRLAGKTINELLKSEDMVKIDRQLPKPKASGLSGNELLAYEVLYEKREVGKNDTPRSLIAASML